jgi:hypothetical protein
VDFFRCDGDDPGSVVCLLGAETICEHNFNA